MIQGMDVASKPPADGAYKAIIPSLGHVQYHCLWHGKGHILAKAINS